MRLIYDTTKDQCIPGYFAHAHATYAAHKLRFRKLPGELAVAGVKDSALYRRITYARTYADTLLHVTG